MKDKLKLVTLIILSSLVCSPLSSAKERPHILVKATDDSAKMSTSVTPNKIIANLNDNETPDEITYSYSPISPPGTCNKDDCSTDTNIEQPILIFDIVVDGEKIPVGQMCTSIGIFKSKTNGMHDIFCGPKYTLKWDGETYD